MLIVPLKRFEEKIDYPIHPNYEMNKYEGFNEKEYYLHHNLSLRKKYKYIAAIDLEDYGYVVDEEDSDLYKQKNNEGSGKIYLEEANQSLRNHEISINGSINGSGMDMSSGNEPIVVLRGLGIPHKEKLTLFQELLMDAYLLEKEDNFKVSFFGYFSAIESFVTSQLETVQKLIPKELHESLERLQLDQKISIVAKHAYETEDLQTIKLWGDLSGNFRELKFKRNKIAHGQENLAIKQDDLNLIFGVICLLVNLSKKFSDITELRKSLYPPKKRR